MRQGLPALGVADRSPGLDLALAVAEAVCLELPLAGAAFWLANALTRGAGAK